MNRKDCRKCDKYLVPFVGRIYLGMHSLIDVIGGLFMGLGTLAFWLHIEDGLDNFVTSGQNGILSYIMLSIMEL